VELGQIGDQHDPRRGDVRVLPTRTTRARELGGHGCRREVQAAGRDEVVLGALLGHRPSVLPRGPGTSRARSDVETGMTRLRTLSAALLLAVATVGFAGCSGSSDDSAGRATTDAASLTDDLAGEADGSGGAPAKDGDAAPTAELVADTDAKKIRTGTVELQARADDVVATANRVATIAEAAGGEVDEQRSTGGDRPSGDLVLRVPPERFREVMGELGEVGTVLSSDSQTRDVTGQYADLEGRLAAMRISVDRLRGFLAKATDVNQIASLESELTRREAELESTQGQLDALSAQVEMATIRVAISSAVPPVAAAEPPSPVGALARGWDAFVAALRYLAAGIAISLPFLLVAVGGALVVRRLRRPQPVSG
jgi:hypothetical protein